MDRNAEEIEQSNQATSFHLGVLFIHGIGAQKRGQTLAEFGEPIYRWLDDRLRGLDRRWREAVTVEDQRKQRRQIEDWATDGFHTIGRPPMPDPASLIQLAEQVKCGDTVCGRVSLADALVADPTDPSAPAHAELHIQRQRIHGRSEVESWLLAESWWTETFIHPSFAEVARWGLHIVPWTIGNHFGSQVRRVLDGRPQPSTEWSRKQTIAWLKWLPSLLTPLLGLFAGLLATPFLLAAIVILLFVWLLPIPQVKEALLKLQRIMASTLGDSYVFVTRPIEAASIVSQVRRDIAWLGARCNAVAIVAHSQGGAIAHMALKEGVPSKLKLLFTFGSGLKKLEQQKYVLSSGRSYVISAFLTLVALFFFSVSLSWFVALPFLKTANTNENIPIMVGMLLVSGIFLTVGILDHLRDIDLADLKRWTKRLRGMLDWVDCFASADPVSNGILIEEIKDLSQEVCNENSVLRDHTSYWRNRDQFVTLLVERLTQPKLRKEASLPLAPELALDESDLVWTGKRRRWRVGIFGLIGWIGLFSVLLAVYQEGRAWLTLLARIVDQIIAWGTAWLSGESTSATSITISWPALGYLAPILALYWIVRWLWRAWNKVEMHTLIAGRIPPRFPVFVYMGIFWQLMVAALLVFGVDRPGWMGLSAIVASGLILATEIQAPTKPKHPEARPLSDESQSHMGQLNALLISALEFLFVPFALGLVGWEIFTWVVGYFGGSILKFQPSEVSEYVVGLLVAMLFAAFYTVFHIAYNRHSVE